MTKVNTHFNRRSFFRTSVAAGGGLALGFSWMAGCKQSSPNASMAIQLPPEPEMPSAWFDINSMLKVGNNGVVTIMSPNPEIGQNVKTSMPMLVAEELGVNWENVIVEQAPLDTEKFQRQVAGGSQSIRFGWESLRMAGATARTMLVAAAAKQWNVEPNTCSVKDGVIFNQNGDQLGFGEVAQAAAAIDVPEEVELKNPKDFSLIGTSRSNVDINEILTGKPLFGIDTKVAGMKYASVLRPPAFGQKLVSFDDAAAKSVVGVEDVIRFDNKIAVLASSNWAAMQGKKALVAEWGIDTPLENSEKHDQEMIALFDKLGEPVRHDGDVAKAFAEADQVLDRTYEAPFLPHNCLEPMNFFADVTEDKIKLLGPIQTPARTASSIAKELDREVEDVELMMTRMGGGFGRRLYGDFAMEAAKISNLAKAPIQLLFTREDDMTNGIYRPSSKYRIKASFKDGQVTGYHLTESCINANMYGLIPNFFPAGAIENYRVDNVQLKSNITIGAWRAPYTNFLGFAEQSFFSELAETMGVDEVQLRLDLLEQAKKNQDDERQQYTPQRMQDCINLVVEKSGWGSQAEGTYQGISAYYSHNTHVAEVANVEMKDGVPTVTKVFCAVDCGIVVNPEAAKNQIEGGIVDGIGHAMFGDLTFVDGKPQSQNFDKFRLIRNQEAPSVEVFFVENELSPTGLGEPSLPPAGGAVANALYKATGERIYKQPFIKESNLLG